MPVTGMIFSSIMIVVVAEPIEPYSGTLIVNIASSPVFAKAPGSNVDCVAVRILLPSIVKELN